MTASGRLPSLSIALTVLLPLVAGAPAVLGAEDASVQAITAPSKAEEALHQFQTSERFPKKGDSGSTSWSTGAYRYDAAGNVTAIGNQYFLYDTSSRLKTAHVTSPSGSVDQIFTYDPYGNVTETNTAGAIASTPAQLGTNHITTPSAEYDDAGNLKQFWSHGDTINYGYDGLSMLAHMTDDHGANVAYVYTADDERIWTYDLAADVSHWKVRDLSKRVLRDFSQTGLTWGLSRDYFYRDRSLLAAALPSGVTEHFSLDHLGTPRLITDQNHNKIGFHTYFAYGTEWFGAGQQENPVETMKFTGHERDGDPTGSGDHLDYMHARYYGALTERFLTVDPVIPNEATANPQLWNRYTYGRNNPLKYTDPDGRLGAPWHFFITLFAARHEGLGWRQAFRLSWQSVKVDFKKGSQSKDAKDTNVHAMRGQVNGRDQTVEEARQATAQGVQDNIQKGTTESVATALHTVQDQAAPKHRDEVWHGIQPTGEFARHMFGDLFPSLTTIREAYNASREVLVQVNTQAPPPEDP